MIQMSSFILGPRIIFVSEIDKNKTVTTVTAIKAARNCLSLEKTSTFNYQNLSIIIFTY